MLSFILVLNLLDFNKLFSNEMDFGKSLRSFDDLKYIFDNDFNYGFVFGRCTDDKRDVYCTSFFGFIDVEIERYFIER